MTAAEDGNNAKLLGKRRGWREWKERKRQHSNAFLMARPWGLDFASPGGKGRKEHSGVQHSSVLRRMVGGYGFIRRKTAAAIPYGEEDEANATTTSI